MLNKETNMNTSGNGRDLQYERYFISSFRCGEQNCVKSWEIIEKHAPMTSAACPSCTVLVHALKVVSSGFVSKILDEIMNK